MTTVAISGTRRAMKELVDGTIRVQIDIDPPFRAAFLSMFPNIDMPIALAPLQIGLPPPVPPKEVVTGPLSSTPPLAKEKHKPSFPAGLCGLAVKWCNDPHFHEWLSVEFPDEWAGNPDAPAEERSKGVICAVCKIDTRKELDTIHSAGRIFRTHIMEPYKQVREDDGIDTE